MIVIRPVQMRALGQARRERFVDDMVAHVHLHFTAEAWLLTQDELRDRVHATIARATMCGLTSERQICRFINLAGTYGWEFDSDPALAWMHRILTDPSLPQAADRLDRLMQTCMYRQDIETRNERLRRENMPAQAPAASERPVWGRDFAGREFANAIRTAADPEEVIVRGAAGYHLSHVLWLHREITMDTLSSGAASVWADTLPALLHRRTEGSHGHN